MTAASRTRICLLIILLLLEVQLQVIAGKPDLRLKFDNKILQESIVKLINDNAQAGWRASMNPRFSNYTVGQFMHLLGVKPMSKGDLKGISVVTHKKDLKLPKMFDARTVWPQCGTIGEILDHGHCSSCWAFGAVEALSDRFCIHFGMNISLSVDLLACCGFMCGDGCDGGYPISTWRYFIHTGVVTEECDPYFDYSGCSHLGCELAYPTLSVTEIFMNGPVEVSFTVYEDFAQSGVYRHLTGDEMGGHAVKLIGWGTTVDAEDY